MSPHLKLLHVFFFLIYELNVVAGKVVESIEMFSYDGMLLQPVPVVHSSKDNTPGGATDGSTR